MMPISRCFRLLMVTVLAANGLPAIGATRVTLRENVGMTKNLVRLGDVAEIACDDADEARDLASLPLMPAPATGSQRFLPKRRVEDIVAAHGVDMKTITFEGAAQVTVVASHVAAPRQNEEAAGSTNGKYD